MLRPSGREKPRDTTAPPLVSGPRAPARVLPLTGQKVGPLIGRPPDRRKEDAPMPLILWLLGIPLSLIVILWLMGVV